MDQCQSIFFHVLVWLLLSQRVLSVEVLLLPLTWLQPHLCLFVLPQLIMVGSRSVGRSPVMFFGIKKNNVVQACCSQFPHCSSSSMNLNTSSSVSFVKSRRTPGTRTFATHTSGGLEKCCCLLQFCSLNLGRPASNFPNSLFVQRLPFAGC